MTKHAFLSASASHRWLHCPPSAKLCEGLPDQSSVYAQEGTDCHELCAYLVEKALGKDVVAPTENLTYYNTEMQNCAEEYCSYVLERLEEAKKYCADPMVFIEQRLDFSRWAELLSVHHHASPCGAVQASQHMQKRTLSRTGSAYNGCETPLLNLHIDTIKSLHQKRLFSVILCKISCL